MRKFFSIALVSSLTLVGMSACGSNTPAPAANTQSNAQMPVWILNPNKDGILGGVGSAKVHFKGSAAQRDLAIQRALNELAKQHGVQVHTETTQSQSDNNGMVSSRAGDYSFQTSDGKVSAHVEAVWQDPNTKEIFVWMRDN